MKRQRVVKAIKKQQQVINKHISRVRKKREGKVLITGTDKLQVYTAEEKRTKIAFIQTGCWGDNINSTLMFKPLIDHFKDCLIDVHTSTTYASAFYNNPHIHKIIQYIATTKENALHLTLTIPEKIQSCGYDHIFAPHPMFNHGHWNSSRHPGLGENLIYAWVHALEQANIECPIPPQSVLGLTEAEVKKVAIFRAGIPEMGNRRNILMECEGESGQTFWDPGWTHAVGAHLVQDKNTNLFISRREPSSGVIELKKKAPDQVFFVGDLSLRECAELFNHCQVFISVSSGLSNACNTNWCKNDITWVEVVNSQVVTSAPIRSENKIFWYENNQPKFITMLKERGI